MGISESLAAAPAPRATDFSYDPNEPEMPEINVRATLKGDPDDEDAPGSPTAKLLRAFAPPQALLADHKWGPVSQMCQDGIGICEGQLCVS
jgi:hypothetical protein